MKAKEHIAAYQARLEKGMTMPESVGLLFKELLTDAHTVAMQRCGKPRPHDGVMRVVLLEQDAKWRKIAREIELNPDGFRQVLAEKGVVL